MANKKSSTKKLEKILIKLANGFYYVEEQIEYQKTQKTSKSNAKSTTKYQNISFFDYVGTDCVQPSNCCDMIKSDGYDKEKFKGFKDDSFSKKKITTHYVPPDISAIKILFEIYSKEMKTDDISSLSDDELLQLKNNLIKELSDED